MNSVGLDPLLPSPVIRISLTTPAFKFELKFCEDMSPWMTSSVPWPNDNGTNSMESVKNWKWKFYVGNDQLGWPCKWRVYLVTIANIVHKVSQFHVWHEVDFQITIRACDKQPIGRFICLNESAPPVRTFSFRWNRQIDNLKWFQQQIEDRNESKTVRGSLTLVTLNALPLSPYSKSSSSSIFILGSGFMYPVFMKSFPLVRFIVSNLWVSSPDKSLYAHIATTAGDFWIDAILVIFNVATIVATYRTDDILVDSKSRSAFSFA